MTYTILVANTAIFGIETILGFLHFYSSIWDWIWISSTPQMLLLPVMGALIPGSILWAQPWRLLTFFFLHAGPIHYALNMWGLFSYRETESRYGSAKFFIIYMLGGFASGLGALVTFLVLPHTPFIVGASGAIYAIGVADGVADWLNAHHSRRLLLLIILIGIVFMLAGNFFAHLTGAIIGGLMGWYFLWKQKTLAPQCQDPISDVSEKG